MPEGGSLVAATAAPTAEPGEAGVPAVLARDRAEAEVSVVTAGCSEVFASRAGAVDRSDHADDRP